MSKLTKKQIAAMERMIDYERYNKEERKLGGGAGLHPSEDKFIITDGMVVVVFNEQPDCLELAEREDFYCKYVDDLMKDDRSIRASAVPTIQECKQVIRDWKKMSNLGKPQRPKVEVSGVDERGNRIVSYFDARLLVNAMEAMGSSFAVFIGRDTQYKLPLPFVTIYREEGRAPYKEVDFNGTKAIVLPCQP